MRGRPWLTQVIVPWWSWLASLGRPDFSPKLSRVSAPLAATRSRFCQSQIWYRVGVPTQHSRSQKAPRLQSARVLRVGQLALMGVVPGTICRHARYSPPHTVAVSRDLGTNCMARPRKSACTCPAPLELARRWRRRGRRSREARPPLIVHCRTGDHADLDQATLARRGRGAGQADAGRAHAAAREHNSAPATAASSS